jgi:tetratricopeptide (TPR) repeat protein
MDLSTSFLIYATLFRLAVIAAGVLIVVLGYRLFLQGLASSNESDAALEGGGFKLTLKNAAPGTSFALFGAVLISAMVIQGSPELDISTAAPGAIGASVKLGQGAGSLRLRGDDAVAPTAQPQLRELAIAASERLLQAGIQKELQNDFTGAMEAYRLALSMPGQPLRQLVYPLNQMAWVYQQQAEPGLALPLALLAQQIDPASVVVMDTLARVYVQLEQFDKAQQLVDRALQSDPGNDDAKATDRLIKQLKPD